MRADSVDTNDCLFHLRQIQSWNHRREYFHHKSSPEIQLLFEIPLQKLKEFHTMKEGLEKLQQYTIIMGQILDLVRVIINTIIFLSRIMVLNNRARM